MNLFFDTSALVKLFYEEEGTDKVTEWVNNPLNTIWLLGLAQLEFICALHRRFRNREINEHRLEIALKILRFKLNRFL